MVDLCNSGPECLTRQIIVTNLITSSGDRCRGISFSRMCLTLFVSLLVCYYLC